VHWSPVGGRIVFATGSPASHNSTIRVLDVANHQITTLPGSTDMFAPRWSPDGQSIPASSLDISKLYRFDIKTQRWSTLYKGVFAYASWSRNSHYIFLPGVCEWSGRPSDSGRRW